MKNTIPVPTSRQNDNDSFDIRSINWLRQHRQGELQAPHTCGRFMLVWINAGDLLHRIDTRDHSLTRALYCVAPGGVHQLSFSEDAAGYIVYFDPLAIEGLPLSNVYFRGNLSDDSPWRLFQHFPRQDSHDVTNIFRELGREFDRYRMRRPQIIYSFVKIILLDLIFHSRPAEVRHASYSGQLVEKFFSLLDQDFKTQKRVVEYASKMSITPNHLNELVKRTTGRSTSFHIRQRIILEAKRRIIYHGMNLKETGHFLGFDDLAHFSKYFKNTLGISFSEFKRTALTTAGSPADPNKIIPANTLNCL